MMQGCIRCHGPVDDEGLCTMCDSKKIDEKYRKAKGGDALRQESAAIAGTTTHSDNALVSNAAPTFNPKGSGTIALHTMVKNGREKLPALLESVTGFCDKAIILDTGSTDGTQKWLVEQDILPCDLEEIPFIDFGTSRTLGMQLAKGKADWLLLLDDDMRLVFDRPKDDVKSSLHPEVGCYMIKHEAPVAYWITRLVHGDQDWEYKGVTHEYLNRSHAAMKLEGLVIDHQYNHGPEKFERDLRLLSADIARDPYDARTIFYLAQTLRDMRHTLPAIRYYEMRARMQGWDQEVYYSLYEASRLAEDPKAMEVAYNYRPSRAEAPQWLAWYYSRLGDDDHAKAYYAHWEKIRKSIPMTEDILFVNVAAYEK